MRLAGLIAAAGALTISGPALAADNHEGGNSEGAAPTQPVELTELQLDRVTAGDLGLPSGRTVFSGFDNPAPNENGYVGFCDEDTGFACHPALTRRSTQAAEATFGHGASLVSGSNEGPWSAALNSPAIELLGI